MGETRFSIKRESGDRGEIARASIGTRMMMMVTRPELLILQYLIFQHQSEHMLHKHKIAKMVNTKMASKN